MVYQYLRLQICPNRYVHFIALKMDITFVDISVSFKTHMSKPLCPFKNGHNGCGYIGPLGPALTSPWSCSNHPLIYILLTITHLTLLNPIFLPFLLYYMPVTVIPVLYRSLLVFALLLCPRGMVTVSHFFVIKPIGPGYRYPTYFTQTLYFKLL
jgi:hypothetical protein